jgi:hypothetical protein
MLTCAARPLGWDLVYWLYWHKTKVQILTLRTHIRQRYARESVGGLQGTQFTRFTGSKVQLLTLRKHM